MNFFIIRNTNYFLIVYRSVRVIDMNEPITIERAQIGRAMYFPQIEWEFSEMSSSSISWQSMNFPIQNQQPDQSESCGNKNIRHHEEKVKNGDYIHIEKENCYNNTT